ncbi:hypothetical protein [Xylanibacter oryzae]|uniref:hypothetical protein n=1 Tax=Xylanibacter oryzae TaxID=185293 RepID=UPI0004B65D2A|nr:hypothetical protein [Xylanibacter oryzae]
MDPIGNNQTKVLTNEECVNHFMMLWRVFLPPDESKVELFKDLITKLFEDEVIKGIMRDDKFIILPNFGVLDKKHFYNLVYNVYSKFLKESLSISYFEKVASSIFFYNGKSSKTIYKNICRHNNSKPPKRYNIFFGKTK